MEKDTFTLDEAADFLNIHRTTMGELAINGEIEGAKIGARWVFLKADLTDYLRKQITLQTSKRKQIVEAKKPPEPVESLMFKMMEMPRNARRKNPLPDLSRYAI